MKEKLLVLDDESLILTSLDHLFEDDYEVFTTTAAGTALQLIYGCVYFCGRVFPGDRFVALWQARVISPGAPEGFLARRSPASN